jgi:DNA modification methylase
MSNPFRIFLRYETKLIKNQSKVFEIDFRAVLKSNEEAEENLIIDLSPFNHQRAFNGVD